MNVVLDLSDIMELDRSIAGGKAFALAKMVAGGLRVPKAVCISTHAYDRFLDVTALPCVTGIPDATTWIQTGDQVTVDGYLGIVTVGQRAG